MKDGGWAERHSALIHAGRLVKKTVSHKELLVFFLSSFDSASTPQIKFTYGPRKIYRRSVAGPKLTSMKLNSALISADCGGVAKEVEWNNGVEELFVDSVINFALPFTPSDSNRAVCSESVNKTTRCLRITTSDTCIESKVYKNLSGVNGCFLNGESILRLV